MSPASGVYKLRGNLSDEFAHPLNLEQSDWDRIQHITNAVGPVSSWERPRFRWADVHLGDDYADGEEGRLDLPRPDLDWFGELLVSARAWRLLEPLMGEHVQALPVDFTTGEECFILNVLTVLAGVIDPVASQAEYFKSGRIMRVERMVFGVDDPLYNWPPAFRIAEMRATRFINAEVRELIRDAGLTGGAFTPVEVRLKPR